MALNPTTSVSNPRIAKLIELEVAGRIKPEHEAELNTYRAQGLAPKSAGAAANESERKASAFLTRAMGANRSYEEQDIGPRSYVGQKMADSAPDFLNVLPGIVGNSPERQVSDSAQDEFIAASLRQDSGAAIPPAELEKQRRIYFPMPGDGPEALQQKRAARLRAISGLQNSTGRSITPEQQAQLEKMRPDLQWADTGVRPKAAPSATPPDGAPLPPDKVVGIGEGITNAIDNAAGLNDGPTKVNIDNEASKQTPEFRAGLAKLLADPKVSGDEIRAYWDKNAPGWAEGEKNAPPPPAAPLAVERGKGGFVEGADAVLRGAADTVSLGFGDEIAAGARTLFGDKTMAENLRAERGVDRYDEENHPVLRGGGQLAGAFVPIGGAWAAGARGAVDTAKVGGTLGAAYGVGSGETLGERFTGGAKGALAGAGSGLVLGKLSDMYINRSAARAAAKRGGAAEQEAAGRFSVRQAADRQGVELMPADVGSPLVARMTAGTAQSPYGVTRIIAGGKRSVESFRNARNRLAGDAPAAREIGESLQAVEQRGMDRVGNAVRDARGAVVREVGVPQDMTGAGQVAQRGANKFIAETSDRATKLYDKIPIEPTADSTLSNTVNYLKDATAGMDSNPKMSALFQSPRLKSYLNALTPETVEIPVPPKAMPGGAPIPQPPQVEQVGGKLSWRDMMEFRTRVGDMLDEPRLSEKIAPRQLRGLYAALSRDMQATARAQGPDAYRAWKRANDFYDGRQKRIEGPLSLLLGTRKDATANEAYSQIERLARDAAGGDFAKLGQVLRSLPPEDAAAIRATMVSRAGETDKGFSPEAFAKAWGNISDRAKTYLIPKSGMRDIMDQAATRAQDIGARGSFAGKSGEAVFEAVEKMAQRKGDSHRFVEMVNNLSPDEATGLRSRLIARMGEATPGKQYEAGNTFSPSMFLTRWNEFSPDAKRVLFGNGELRSAMDDLVKVSSRMKEAQSYANFSGSGGAISVDKTNTGLAGAALALFSGHPVIAAGLASPALIQNFSARLLTSPKMVRWLAAAPKAVTPAAERLHIRRLSNIATRDPTIRNEVMQLQSRLLSAMNDNAPRASAASGDRQEQNQ